MQLNQRAEAPITGWRSAVAHNRGRGILLAGAAASGFLGFTYSTAIIGGLSHAFSEWLVPMSMTLYLAGVALCT